MVSGREIVPVGEVATTLYNDMSLNVSNGPASPKIVKLGNYEGMTAKMPEHAFYIYGP